MQHSRDVYSHITEYLSKPTVLKRTLENWPSRKWTPGYLASVLKEKKLRIRSGPVSAKNMSSVLWETECTYEEATLAEFCEWLSSDSSGMESESSENPLLKYSRERHWCYVDYKEMAVLFQDYPDILEAVRWTELGFPDRNGKKSTIWIGSEGAFTPCHYDTYGFNLVAQIYGRKRWHLFPPSQTNLLYPTRIPYEESSVFSPVNIAKPSLEHYPRFAEATPYIVTLEAGDVLFVPKHWWHYVESLEVSISVNTWVEVESDKESRVHEAVTRALVSCLMSSSCDQNKWINPTESICEDEVNYRYIEAALQECSNNQSSKPNTQGDGDSLEHQRHRKGDSTSQDIPAQRPQQGCDDDAMRSEGVTGIGRRREMRDGGESSDSGDSLKYCATGSPQNDDDNLIETSVAPLEARPELEEEERDAVCMDKIRTCLKTQTGGEDSIEISGDPVQAKPELEEAENITCLRSQSALKRSLVDSTGSINQSKLSKTDQDQSSREKAMEIIQKFIVPVKCQGQIYKAIQHLDDSSSCSVKSHDEDVNMQIRSEVKHVDDIRQLLAECVTHPTVISLTATLLQEKFDHKT